MIALAVIAGLVWLAFAVIATVADLRIAGPRRVIAARERRARWFAPARP